MTDLLDKPVGDFEWGPEKRRLLSPWLAIVAGALIMVAGFVLTGLSLQSATAAAPDRAAHATVPVATAAPSKPDPASTQTPQDPSDEPQPQTQAQSHPQSQLQGQPPEPDAEPAVGVVVVHVTGWVAHPGIVELPTDARVVHAIEAAGGVLSDADLDSLNLAAYLDDGAQIHVPSLTPDRFDTADERSTAVAEVAVPALWVTSSTPPTELWGPDEPAPVPPEIEALMADRETAPDPAVIDDLLRDAGLDLAPPDA